MAEVVAPEQPARHAGSIGAMSVPPVPTVDMMPSPDIPFQFPPPVSPPAQQDHPDDASRRPVSASMHIAIPRSDATNAHRRTASTLPSFSFNATDNSGRQDDEMRPRTPDESPAVTPVRRGHRRGGSEFVGGDSRLGVSNALSSSPTKSSVLPDAAQLAVGASNSRRGHAHRRSAAISNHDIGKLIQPTAEVQPRLSCSLPNTPLEFPAEASVTGGLMTSPELDREVSDPFGAPLGSIPARPPSRPRVEFSDNVEFIPRPLSTISSGTESSVSTIRGHSVNNSISSVLSLSTPSPPSTRTPRIMLNTAQEDEMRMWAKSSVETSKRNEREGQWLKRRSSQSPTRPVSESAVSHSKIAFADPDAAVQRKRSLSHALGFDRRRSEPSMGSNSNEPSRLSTISLQEQSYSDYQDQDLHDGWNFEPKSSARKIRDWAASKLSKKAKESNKALTSSSTSSIRPDSAGSASVHGRVSLDSPVAETDLDTVFSSQENTDDSLRPRSPGQSRIEVMTPTPSQYRNLRLGEQDEFDTVLDLDAALGPFKTPPIGSHRQRKELHSNRLAKDFSGPGGHYHRRSESEPNLAPFIDPRDGQPSMADVFEEEEEDAIDLAPPSRPTSTDLPQDNEVGIGIQIMDVHIPGNATFPDAESDEEFDLRENWGPERPPSPLGNSRSISSHILFDRRGSSIIEETILEETGSGDNVKIVDADEEPRVSSQTKSSDSSDTPTIVATEIGSLTVPDSHQLLTTPEILHTSTFSSPVLRQGSFDTHRLDTAASSITDNRTLSSCATGDHGHDLRISVDVPSLTSSRSTMISSVPGNNSRRDFGNADPTLSTNSESVEPSIASERRRKRGSIQSLSQLVGSPFGAKSKGFSDTRPQSSGGIAAAKTPKKEHRLKKLMFWKSKQPSTQSQHLKS